MIGICSQVLVIMIHLIQNNCIFGPEYFISNRLTTDTEWNWTASRFLDFLLVWSTGHFSFHFNFPKLTTKINEATVFQIAENSRQPKKYLAAQKKKLATTSLPTKRKPRLITSLIYNLRAQMVRVRWFLHST